jgi:hypothetical protein
LKGRERYEVLREFESIYDEFVRVGENLLCKSF